MSEERRFHGVTDDALTAEGVEDARRAAHDLRDADVSRIVSSPLRRALGTAAELARCLGTGVRVEEDPGLADVDVGSWQGLTAEDVRRRDARGFDAYLRFPTAATFPGGERLRDAERRALEALARVAPAVDAGDVVAVTHELVIRLVLVRLRALEGTAIWDPHVEPGSVVALRVMPDGLELPTTLEDLFRAADRRRTRW